MTESSLCESKFMDELNKHIESIAGVPLFSELSADHLRDVVSICKLKNFSKHDFLFNEGDFYLGFYILLEGSVKVFKTNSDGDETVVHIVKPLTEFADIPLFEGIDYPVSAQCLEDCLVVFIPKDEFLKLIKEDHEISLKMLSGFAKRLKSLISQIEDLSTKEVVNRLAKYLIKEIKLKENENIPEPFVKLTIPRSTTASYLGTVTETLSRAFRKLQNEKILRMHGKVVFIQDLKKLKELAK